MKIALPLMLAWYFQKHEGRIGWWDFALAAALIIAPVYLIKRQPDLGTSLLIAASGLYVLYLAGLSWKIMVGLAALGAAAGPFVWQHLHDYQRERILTFIDPTAIRSAPAITRRRRRSRSAPAASWARAG
jgi:rod shape determining protein RodA